MSTKPVTALLADPDVTSPLAKQTRASAAQGVHRSEINVSGNKVLLAMATAFLLTNGLIWVVVRYWLFAP